MVRSLDLRWQLYTRWDRLKIEQLTEEQKKEMINQAIDLLKGLTLKEAGDILLATQKQIKNSVRIQG